MGVGETYDGRRTQGSVAGDGGRTLRSRGMKERLYWQRGLAILAYERTGMDGVPVWRGRVDS